MTLHRPALIALVALMVGLSAAAAPKPTPLTPDGWGNLRIGMRERDAVRLFHLRVPRDLGADSFDCRQDELPNRPGVAVMAQRGVVTRISVEAPSRLLTDRGFGLGSSETAIKQSYGAALKIDTAAYEEEPAHDLTFWKTHARRGVRYETNAAGRVESIFVGDRSIKNIEGCS